jgi:uncharacterized membrane protein
VTNTKGRSLLKILAVIGMVLLFAIGFLVLGLVIDIQIMLEYNYTPIPFTFTLPFVGALVGFLIAIRTVTQTDRDRKFCKISLVVNAVIMGTLLALNTVTNLGNKNIWLTAAYFLVSAILIILATFVIYQYSKKQTTQIG